MLEFNRKLLKCGANVYFFACSNADLELLICNSKNLWKKLICTINAKNWLWHRNTHFLTIVCKWCYTNKFMLNDILLILIHILQGKPLPNNFTDILYCPLKYVTMWNTLSPASRRKCRHTHTQASLSLPLYLSFSLLIHLIYLYHSCLYLLE